MVFSLFGGSAPRSSSEIIGRDKMKAAVYAKFGNPEDVLEIREIDVPTYGPSDVLIEIHNAALNPVDWKFMTGYNAFVDFLAWRKSISNEHPYGTGFDVSGRIIAVGQNVKTLKVGDEVYGMTHFLKCGTVAEYIAIDEGYVALKPSNLDFKEAAGVPLVTLTSYQALETANIQEGDRVLILGGSSATGSMAVQLAKLKKAHVITTCSERNVELCKKLGADEIINYTESKWHEVLPTQSIDVIYDCAEGGDAYHNSYKVLKPGKHFLTIVGDKQGALSIPVLLSTGYIIGSRVLRSWITKAPKYGFVVTKTNSKDLSLITGFLERKEIEPIVDAVYDFEKVVEAFAYQKTGKARGKVVIRVRQ